MPGFNQTGPMGQGPMTGRRMGRCTNFGASLKNDVERGLRPRSTTSESQAQQYPGRGPVFGFGRGRGGRGRGMGRQNRFRREF
jgi:hypothetical protein